MSYVLDSGDNEMVKKYKFWLDSSPHLIAEISEEGIFLAVNSEVIKTFGVDGKDIVGKHIFEVMPGEMARKLLKAGKDVIKEKKTRTFEDLIKDQLYDYHQGYY